MEIVKLSSCIYGVHTRRSHFARSALTGMANSGSSRNSTLLLMSSLTLVRKGSNFEGARLKCKVLIGIENEEVKHLRESLSKRKAGLSAGAALLAVMTSHLRSTKNLMPALHAMLQSESRLGEGDDLFFQSLQIHKLMHDAGSATQDSCYTGE